jgi:hypothetical protein
MKGFGTVAHQHIPRIFPDGNSSEGNVWVGLGGKILHRVHDEVHRPAEQLVTKC